MCAGISGITVAHTDYGYDLWRRNQRETERAGPTQAQAPAPSEIPDDPVDDLERWDGAME